MKSEMHRHVRTPAKYFRSRLLFLILWLLTAVSCQEVENPVPVWRVYLNLDLAFEDKELKAVPAYKTYTIKDVNLAQGESIGYGGVLVVHNMFGEYKAFDLSCPYETSQDVLVEVDDEVLYAVCPVCGTKYDVGTGNGAPNGKSRHSLRIYNVIQNGNKLVVTN
ncbi:MAG: (2Fe-2S)-binding protein [Tannerella sp.]|nr:(2Fe-2S)-binding protein [Tannerella sp.]